MNKFLICQTQSAVSQFQTKVNRFEKNGARLKITIMFYLRKVIFARRRDPILASDGYLCGRDGQGAGARGISTKMIKVSTTGAKKWSKRSECVFHLHICVEGAAVGSNRVLMFERQTEIFLF